MTKEDYLKIAPTVPTEPGVYRFINAEEEILYIGKAKHIKKRVSSYFGNRKDMRRKTKIMVKNSVRLEFTIVDTEQDALLLEATLIQKHQPRYNVALKSGKPYPYICIKNERFPRVFVARDVTKDGSRYFGPYVSKKRVYALLELVKNLFKLRTCNFNLSQENVDNGKFKVCLEYHIKNCQAPCANLETERNYNKKVDQIANILKGNFGSVKRYLKEQMMKFAEDMEFERAHEIKVQLDALEDYQGKSTVVNPKIKDVDVFSMHVEDDLAYVNYIKVINGAIINTFTLEFDINLNNAQGELLVFAIQTLRARFNSIAPELIVPFEIPCVWEAELVVPKIGDKKKLLDLSQKNLMYYVLQKKKNQAARANKKTSTDKVLEIMRKDLRMSALPLHIECFDNSNLQGTNPVAAMVVFKNAKPAKRDYRHYHIKTVDGPDDFASMEEIVYRRYKRLLDTNAPLPSLIVIDGGKGQLSAAVKSLKKLDLQGKITIIGIAKRLEEIFFPGDSTPLLLSKKSPTLKVIQQARNEAHRFAIEFHRLVRSKKFITSELTGIDGIGKTSADKLLSAFGSVEKIKKASFEDLSAVVNKRIAQKIIDYYNIPRLDL